MFNKLKFRLDAHKPIFSNGPDKAAGSGALSGNVSSSCLVDSNSIMKRNLGRSLEKFFGVNKQDIYALIDTCLIHSVILEEPRHFHPVSPQVATS